MFKESLYTAFAFALSSIQFTNPLNGEKKESSDQRGGRNKR